MVLKIDANGRTDREEGLRRNHTLGTDLVEVALIGEGDSGGKVRQNWTHLDVIFLLLTHASVSKHLLAAADAGLVGSAGGGREWIDRWKVSLSKCGTKDIALESKAVTSQFHQLINLPICAMKWL